MEMKKFDEMSLGLFENPTDLHGAVGQRGAGGHKRSICVTLTGETADNLYQLVDWTGQSYALILEQLISFKRIEMFWAGIRRIEQETGQPMKYDDAKAFRGNLHRRR